jgi:tRNA (guanine37-N1)-methyltransferase
MLIDIITLFPNMYSGVFSESLINKAIENKICEIKTHNLRDYSKSKHKNTDDTSYGGGPGMVFLPEPLLEAINKLKQKDSHVILTCPKGNNLSQSKVKKLKSYNHLIIIAAHYEGIDQRITDQIVDETISVGDYVLCGGEIPSMIICEAVIRLLPGVVGNNDSITQDSFENNLLDHPHYTKPAEFLGQKVPSVLLSGNHKNIDAWRLEQKLASTLTKRPDLLSMSELSKKEKSALEKFLKE